MIRWLQKAAFALNFKLVNTFLSYIRITKYKLLGAQIGKGTFLSKIYTTWPHQIKIGKHCLLERDVYFKFDGIHESGPSIIIGDSVFLGHGCEFNIRKRILIGNDCLIASGCKFIDHDHGIALKELMRFQHGAESDIIIGNNVWLGVNVVLLKGVIICDGAVVAAGAVVTKSVPSNEIWGGIPAKKIGGRK